MQNQKICSRPYDMRIVHCCPPIIKDNIPKRYTELVMDTLLFISLHKNMHLHVKRLMVFATYIVFKFISVHVVLGVVTLFITEMKKQLNPIFTVIFKHQCVFCRIQVVRGDIHQAKYKQYTILKRHHLKIMNLFATK